MHVGFLVRAWGGVRGGAKKTSRKKPRRKWCDKKNLNAILPNAPLGVEIKGNVTRQLAG